MGIITSSSFAKALWPGVNSWYGKAYNEHETFYNKLFDTTKSSRAYEEDVGVSSFGLAQIKPEGQAIAYDSESQAFITRYAHTVYALGFIMTREIMEDDQYAVVGERRAGALARSMRQTKEIVAHNVYNRAFSGSYVGGDNVAMISATHPNWAGGTWSNKPSTDAALSQASLEQAVIDLKKYTDDRGLRISVQPNKLIIPVDLEMEAMRILKTPYETENNYNNINPLYTAGFFKGGYVATPYLTSATAWFIRTNVTGMKHFERRAMEFAPDNDFETENAKFKATERYSFGWTDPRSIYGCDGVA